MKTDRYTKIVLTIIAACLVWIIARDVSFISIASATPTDRGDEVVKVQIVSIDESNILRWEALPVKIEN
jgi:hypothetical protein